MNPHIELVKKWLADSKSVSLKELEETREHTWNAAGSAVGNTAMLAVYSAYDAAWSGDGTRLNQWVTLETAKYVKEYEELTK